LLGHFNGQCLVALDPVRLAQRGDVEEATLLRELRRKFTSVADMPVDGHEFHTHGANGVEDRARRRGWRVHSNRYSRSRAIRGQRGPRVPGGGNNESRHTARPGARHRGGKSPRLERRRRVYAFILDPEAPHTRDTRQFRRFQ